MAEYEDQKKLKPSIDILVAELLSESLYKTAEEFISFLRDNKLNPVWGAKNSYNVKFKNVRICILKIFKDSFEIRAATQYNGDFVELYNSQSDEVRRFLLSSLTFCNACGTCKPGVTMKIDNSEYKGLCYNPVVNIMNPDSEYLELAKMLVLIRKKVIADGDAPKTTYIAASKRQ